jgi:hypothetical protein
MARLDPIGFEPTKRGDRRMVRNSQGRVSSFKKLDRRDLEYIRWLEQQKQADAAA